MTKPDILPNAARAKLMAVQGAADDAREAAASASRRITDISRALSYSETPPADAANLEHELSRLKAVRDKENWRQRERSSLAANISTWLLNQRGEFEVVTDDTKPEPGETAVQAVGRVRARIDEIRLDLSAIERAPLPKDDLKALARDRVEKLAARGAPRVATERGSLTIEFGDPDAFGPSPDTAVALAAWLHPDEMLARLSEAIDDLPDHAGALSEAERRKRLSEGRSTLDTLERAEESLVAAAIATGVDILRRPDASPLAVLGIRAKRAAQAKAA